MGDPNEHVSDDPQATFRVPALSRWAHAITLAVLVAMTGGMLSTARLSWVLVLFAALVIVQTMNTVVLWRWQVTTDDAGIEVQQGLQPPRRLPWGEIRTVRRTLPPTIEVEGADDLRLGAGIPRKLLHRTAAHINAHAGRRRADPGDADHGRA